MPNLKVQTTAHNAVSDLAASTDQPITQIPYTPWRYDASDWESLFKSYTGVGPKPTLDADEVGYWGGGAPGEELLGYLSGPDFGSNPVYRPSVLNNKAVIEGNGVDQHLQRVALGGALSFDNFSFFIIQKLLGVVTVLGDQIFSMGENTFAPWQTDNGICFCQVSGADGKVFTSSSIAGTDADKISTLNGQVADFRTGFFLREVHGDPAAVVDYVNGAEEGRDDAWRGTPITPDYIRMFAGGAYGPSGNPSTPLNWTNAQVAEVIFYDRKLTVAEINYVRAALMFKWLPESPYMWLG